MSAPAAGLRAQCLNIWEVLAQSVAMLGPTMTPVLIVPLMFASAGNASWLAYAFGSLMLLAVALNIREFASRSSSSGSLYTFAESAFGMRGSLLCGWSWNGNMANAERRASNLRLRLRLYPIRYPIFGRF